MRLFLIFLLVFLSGCVMDKDVDKYIKKQTNTDYDLSVPPILIDEHNSSKDNNKNKDSE